MSDSPGPDAAADATPEAVGDNEVDLVIALPTAAAIVDAARAASELAEEADNEDVQDEENLDDSDPDAMDGALRGLIDELNEDEQAALIALTWVGRGDYDTADWAEAMRLARERNADGGAADYLVGMEMFGDLLSEGLAAFGYPVEEVAR